MSDVARAYREALRATGPGTLTEIDLDGYDRTGVPVVATVWDDGRGDAHGVGYGATREAATIGALGEVAERVLLTPAVRATPPRRASFRELRRELGADGVADPVSLTLEAGTGDVDDRPLDWLPAVRWRTGETVLVPAEFVASDPASLPSPAAGPPLVRPVTNGLGAGDTAERAVGHGLLELLQRDGDTVSFRALDQGAVIDIDALDEPSVAKTLARLRAVGIEPVVKLASTEFVTVVYCSGLDDDPSAPPMALGAMGEAAHPDSVEAITKSLLEFASSRARRVFAFGPLDRVRSLHPDYLDAELSRPLGEQEPRALQEMTAWAALDAPAMRDLLAASPFDVRRSTVDPTLLPRADVPDPGRLLALLLGRLENFDVLVMTAEVAGMHAAKVIVPGLEVETLSYHRVGERVARRLLDRGDALVGRGAPDAPGRRRVVLRPEAEDRLGGPVWFDVDLAARTVDQLYPLYREPRRHAPQRIAAQHAEENP